MCENNQGTGWGDSKPSVGGGARQEKNPENTKDEKKNQENNNKTKVASGRFDFRFPSVPGQPGER